MLTMLAVAAAMSLAADEAPDWSALARDDIEFIHAQTLEHHPGPVDSENPDFMATMERARTRGLDLASRADSQAGYAMSLRAYAAAYLDGHYGVSPQSGVETYQWPGFISVRRGARWFVSSRRDDVDHLDGAELLDCDGRSPDAWMEDRVFGFQGNPALAADWTRRAPQIMVDRANPFVANPQSCRFALAGAVETIALDWQDIDADPWWDLAIEASRPEPAPWGLREFAPGAFWIGTPSFGPRDEALAVMQSLIAELQTRSDELRAAEVLVFDVRGNNGGSSDWGDQIVAAIWGEDYAAYRAPRASTGVDYRISPGNIEHARWIIGVTVEQNMPEAERYFREVLDGMLAAQSAGADFYEERRDPEAPRTPARNPVSARTYFLTDSACGSACLDFADRMYGLETVLHVGSETYADSDYMELRQIALPSGLGNLGLPIKVYRGRPRASGASYTPAIAYDGSDWSTAALEDWILGLAR